MKAKKHAGLLALLVAVNGWMFSAEALAADPRNGAKLYNMHCSSCHGPKGQGMMPGTPDFGRDRTLFAADPVLVQVIEQGRGVMPAYRGLMSTQDILDVIAHLRTFK